MSDDRLPFCSIYAHGFVRAAVCTPQPAIASAAENLRRTLDLARQAATHQAVIAVFPELGLSAYSNEDLFLQDALLDAVESAVAELVEASRALGPVIIAGAPLRHEAKLFNCALLVHRGRILGIVPKTYLPNYREFYERRQFTPGDAAVTRTIRIEGEDIPFGRDLLFAATDNDGLAIHVEICEDLWVPIPPSTDAALAGATVLVNLSASNATIGKADYRRLLCASQSGRCLAAYLYSAAGPGESTTDLAWDGHALIYENAELLAEGERFPGGARLVLADLDLDRLRQERARTTSFNDCAAAHRARLAALRRIPFRLEPPTGEVPTIRRVDRFPFVPADPARRDERCREAYDIQVQGLAQRLRATGIGKAVIGVSGGLDSAQALLVTAKAFDELGLPRGSILGFNLPGFASSRRTQDSAHRLMAALGVTAAEIDIRPSALQMLKDIDHPFARGEAVHDITFENIQAGERTSHLFRLANLHGAIVIGTSDLSELALGYTTYGVGDHMSHYAVNVSVPKTLIRHLVRWSAETGAFGDDARGALRSILDTPISPELVPGSGDVPSQLAEETVGPYELQDFNLYYLSRYGYRPSKVAFLAECAWRTIDAGDWPDWVPAGERREYDLATILKWLELFLVRFFQSSQFKRSAMPNGPKIGSGGSLSPRGDWRAPSDAGARTWVDELHRNAPAPKTTTGPD